MNYVPIIIVALIIAGAIFFILYKRKHDEPTPVQPPEPVTPPGPEPPGPITPPGPTIELMNIVTKGFTGIGRGLSQVTSLKLGSADIFGYEYDFVNNHWLSAAGVSIHEGTPVDTYFNDSQALLIVEDLEFNPDGTISGVKAYNLPENVMDILYIDNRWHRVNYQGEWYGDGDTSDPLNERLNKFLHDEDLKPFTALDLVFINNNIFTKTHLFSENPSDAQAYQAANPELTLVEVQKAQEVFEEVRLIEEFALFIPFEPIPYPKDSKEIIISVNLSTLIESVNETEVIYEVGLSGSPIEYSITVNDFLSIPLESTPFTPWNISRVSIADSELTVEVPPPPEPDPEPPPE